MMSSKAEARPSAVQMLSSEVLKTDVENELRWEKHMYAFLRNDLENYQRMVKNHAPRRTRRSSASW